MMPTRTILLRDHAFRPDPSGVLWWPERRWLLVADLHLEKATALAQRSRRLLPPYDSTATLARLGAAIDRLDPAAVVALGDSFHDSEGADRLAADDLAMLTRLARGRDWTWVLGNHDPDLPATLPGDRTEELRLDGLVCRHVARPGDAGEISGHYHPKAAVDGRAGRVTGRCFVADSDRLVLPAFGAYTGGLDVLDPAIRGLLAPAFHVWLIGRAGLHRFPGARLSPIALRFVDGVA
ncbi:ligase-associated DNA damage response endonuclease PdeM [Inquilinus limosus]|uniref:ligase-associated DNA damage response endonuclease PdeM n=1 Tax=Inquilinus limosus TaxID=171674 RepID=UPI003F135F6A